MKLIIGVITALLSIQIGYTQTECDCVERLSHLADYYFTFRQFDSALVTYERALDYKFDETYEPYNDLVYAKYLGKMSQFDSAFVHLKRYYRNGGYSIEHNYDFKEFVKTSYFEQLNQTKQVTPVNFNWNLHNALQRMRGLDQAIRQKDGISRLFTNSDSLYSIADSINYVQVNELLNTYGIFTYKTHGVSFNKLHLFLLHHSVYSKAQFEEIKDLLDLAISLGVYEKSSLARLIDRRRSWVDSLPQLYGAFTNYLDKFMTIENLEKVDSMRFTMNLLTLEHEALMNSRKLPEGYVSALYPKNYFCESRDEIGN